MAWRKNDPNLTNDPTYLEPRITDVERIVYEQEHHEATFQHGLNILNSTQSGPLKVEFYGNTLVNHVVDFNHNSWVFQNATIVSSKKIEMTVSDGTIKNSYIDINCSPNARFLVAVKHNGYIDINFYDASGSFISNINNSTNQYEKITTPSNATRVRIVLQNNGNGTFTFEELRLYSINQVTYDKIGVSLTDADVERMFPYVDSIKGVKNPVLSVSGKNLYNGKLESGVWNSSGKASGGNYVRSDEKLHLAGNTNYTISTSPDLPFTSVVFYDENGSSISSSTNKTFTTPSNVSYIGFTFNSTDTTAKVQVEIGSSASPYTDYNPSYLYAETTLYGNDNKKDILFRNESLDVPRWEKTKWFGSKIFDGTETCAFVSDNGTNTTVKILADASLPSGDRAKSQYEATKDDGTPLQKGYTTEDDHVWITSGYAYFTITDADATGYDLTTTTGIQTFFTDKNYFLLYQLQDSVVEPVTVEGDLSIQGDAQVEVIQGTEYGEPTFPTSYDGRKFINVKGSSSIPDNPLNYKAKMILRIYRDGVDDTNNWIIGTSGVTYGDYYAYCYDEDYDVNANYTVDYVAYNEGQTANLNNVVAHYNKTMKSSFQQVVAKQSDIATEVSIHDRQILDLMIRLDAGGL